MTATVEHRPQPALGRSTAPSEQQSDTLTIWGDRKFRPDIQGLRALAIILVVLYHATVPGVTGGFVGVDVFFVISGFLITRQLITEASVTGRISVSRFYVGRVRRLVPASLTVVLLTALAAYFWGPVLRATATAHDGLLATLYSINYGLIAQGVDYQHTTSSVSPFIHFWSLAVEEQYYLICPILIGIVVFTTRRATQGMRTGGLILIVSIVAAFSLADSIAVTAVNPPLAYFSLQSRAWEFAAGALVALGIPLLRRIPAVPAAAMSWIGFALILYSAVVFTDATAFPSYNALVPVIGASAVIAAGLHERRGGVEALLRNRPVQFFGSVSYSWYLWHWPLIVLAPYLFQNSFGVHFETSFGWREKLEVSLISLWIGVASYLVFEHQKKRPRPSRKLWFGVGAALTASVASVCLILSLAVPAAVGGTGSHITVLGADAERQHALVEAAADVKILPAQLSPSLSSAADDVPRVSNDCLLDFFAVTSGSCVYGDPTAKRKILLFGDSHAEQWFAAVDKIGRDQGWQVIVWTKVGCGLPQKLSYNSTLKRNYSECVDWHNGIYPRIAKLAPDVIVASQFTYDGSGTSGEASGSASALERLSKLTPRVIYLADTPGVSTDIPACLAQNVSDIRRCDSIPSAASKPAEAADVAAERDRVDAAVARAGVAVVDPEAWFCTARACPAVIANTIVYRDASHVTQQYVLGLAPLVSAALKSVDPAFAAKG